MSISENALIRNFHFKPTDTQNLAKASYHRRLAELSFMYSRETLSLAQTAALAGCSTAQIEEWNLQNGWAAWFFEADTAERLLMAHKELAVKTIIDLIHLPLGDGRDGSIQPKDKLKAVELLARLADMEPNRRKEVTFIDKDLGKMQADEVDNEMLKLKNKLEKKRLTAGE